MSSYIIQECKNVFVLIEHGSVKTSDDLPRKRWKSLGLRQLERQPTVPVRSG